jgi:hypothetical protein
MSRVLQIMVIPEYCPPLLERLGCNQLTFFADT